MPLNKNGMDLKAIRRDQKVIDKLPNKGLAKSHALHEKMEGKKGEKKEHGNPKGVMEANNRKMMEGDEHNRSWNGKKYTK